MLLCVFVSTFSGLVYWQYGDDIASLFAPIDNADGANANLVAPGSAYDQIAAETMGNEAGVNAEGSLIGGAATIKGADDINNNFASSDDTVNASVNTQSNEAAQNQPEALITSWQNAISKDTGDLSKKGSALPQDKRAASGTSENANGANTANLAEPKPSLNTDASASGPELGVTSSTEAPFIAPNEYALQMLAMKNEQVLNDFIEENNLAQQTRVYKTRRYSGDWYVVIYAQTFSSATQAQQAKQALPDYPGNGSAFVKNGQQILQEIALSESR